MKNQKKVWEEAHANPVDLPSLASDAPSEGVVYFTEFLSKKGVFGGKALDVGCGQGRNAVYLAEKGFLVYAFDFVKKALEETLEKARLNDVEKRLCLSLTSMDAAWPFPADFFDAAVDSFSSIDVETLSGREKCRFELLRTLKAGGYAFISVVSAEDELEKQFIKQNPGKEKNSCHWPVSNKFQKDYDEEELIDFYKDFEIVELKEVKKQAFKLGRNYTATNYWVIVRKP